MLLDKAACRGTFITEHVDFFRDELPEAQRKKVLDLLKEEYCDRCPVQELCSDFAIENGYSGFWGHSQRYRNQRAKYFGIRRARA